MNRSLNILWFLLLSFASADAQPDSVSTYYPISVGTYWMYRFIAEDQPENPINYYTVEIIGDTVMPNGKAYQIFHTQATRQSIFGGVIPASPFRRLDIPTGNVYAYNTFTGSEGLMDSLYSKFLDISASWNGRVRCSVVDTGTFLGFRTPFKTFMATSFPLRGHTLAKGLGLVETFFGNENMQSSLDYFYLELVYAKIEGNYYGIPVSVRQPSNSLLQFTLEQNYPNPFNSNTTISFVLPKQANTRVYVYDIRGVLLEELHMGILDHGRHHIHWNATGFASGVYYYRVQTPDFHQVKPMILIK